MDINTTMGNPPPQFLSAISAWSVVCLVADVPGKPIVLTEADCPELRNYVGDKFILHERERSSINPAELTFGEWGYTLKAVYTVSEAG